LSRGCVQLPIIACDEAWTRAMLTKRIHMGGNANDESIGDALIAEVRYRRDIRKTFNCS